jgi:multiple sugar transport system substrate-binding protein
MKGKKFSKAACFIAFFLITLFCFSLSAQAESKFNWRKYEGTTIRTMLGKSAFTKMTMKYIKEFEKLTGIKVVHEHYSSAPLRRKLMMELAAKNKDLDVFQGMMKTNYQYYKAGWLEPLDKYINNPSLTSPDYAYNDMFPRVRSVIDGKTIGITTSVNPQVLMYRKDTLDTNGDGKTDIYGWIARMNKENTAPFANWLYTNGARYLDENRNPVFNSPEAVEAMKVYGHLMRTYGPPGGSTIGWREVIGAFAQGKAAMTVEIAIFVYLVLENPKRSKVAGKVGYAPFPPGKPGNHITMMPCNTNHVSAYSEKKEAAWYLAQFLTDKERSLGYKLKGLPVSRRSSWHDPKWIAADKFPELTKIMLRGFENGLVGFEIPIAGFVEARQHISRTIFSAYEGADVQKAADDAVEAVREIMKRTE